MTTSGRTLRTCNKGHRYYKSSECPVCPICESKRMPSEDFLKGLPAPARRALEREGITSLKKLANCSIPQILAWHGVGPSTIPKLKALLESEGLRFKETK